MAGGEAPAVRTEKKNFRCDPDLWNRALDKAEVMRRNGYDIDMTKLLTKAVAEFVDEREVTTAARLDITRGPGPVGIYRRPAPRVGVSAADLRAASTMVAKATRRAARNSEQ